MRFAEPARQFSGPPVEATFDGILFDNDGTLVDSAAAVENYWHECVWSNGYGPHAGLTEQVEWARN